jgi:hypothetical protein
MAKDPLDYGAELDTPQPDGPILGIRDLAVLLRMGSVGSARLFAREHLTAARLPQFGTHHRYCRESVLRLLGLPLKDLTAKREGHEPT